jgi:hypothetical protein
MKIPSWPHLLWEIFPLNRQNLRFIYPSLSQIFFMCNGGKQIFAFFPKAGCATFFCPGVVSDWSGHFFIL